MIQTLKNKIRLNIKNIGICFIVIGILGTLIYFSISSKNKNLSSGMTQSPTTTTLVPTTKVPITTTLIPTTNIPTTTTTKVPIATLPPISHSCKVNISTNKPNIADAYDQMLWVPELSKFIISGTTLGRAIILDSSNGLDWTRRLIETERASYSNTSSFMSASWSPVSGFILWSNRNIYYTSTNGTNWTRKIHYDENADVSINNFMGSDSRFIYRVPELGLFIVGADYQIYTSISGANWQLSASLGTQYSTNWNKIVWSPELRRLVVHSTTTLETATSIDGLNWEMINFKFPYKVIDWFWCKEKGIFMALCSVHGYNISEIYISSDGLSWSKDTTTPVAPYWSAISYAPELDLFAGVLNDNLILWKLGYQPSSISTGVGKRFTLLKWNPQWKSFILSTLDGAVVEIKCA